MEKSYFTANWRSQLWFIFLFVNILCLLLLLIDYSSIIGSKIEMKAQVDLCLERYIYVHDLPSRFNEEVLKNCRLLNRKTDKFDMCMFIMNSGFGPEVENSSGVLSNTSWFNTNQFLLEVIFHNRMKNYECLTNDSSLASAVFVPFYTGLDLRRHLWSSKTSVRDSSGADLLRWLAEKPEWKKMEGMDHFLVAGRIARDFRRQTDKNSDWGSKFRFLPESQNISMLSIESSSWNNDFAIPYPTYFHPRKHSEVLEWQDRMRRQKRQYLFSFAGAPRSKSKEGSIRGKIMDQCVASSSECKLLDCSDNTSDCNNPVNVMKVFQNSVFCLQPPGDSFTRRSIFDSILAGCIPVFFHPGSAYAQYTWHLPRNHTKYSVYIPGRKLRERRFRINEILLGVSEEDEEAMREEVISLIPRIIYTNPRSKLEDAFDLAVKGILDRVDRVRRAIREGKDPSIGFSERNDLRFKIPLTAAKYFARKRRTERY
ncbi:putative Xyloglucan galactosyltransferase KATAMARI1 [Melia azedarach]|uniref:Xyloglucan galactosyltransferase KATAMARI1 n=1 Tax=Melia azedarach TaxID=155640 RepID=A0ACC1YHS6_MELAZ|nr:putative Xyloglucan galactosyltransferase KATAMARI1 [Melia azedarach]